LKPVSSNNWLLATIVGLRAKSIKTRIETEQSIALLDGKEGLRAKSIKTRIETQKSRSLTLPNQLSV